jgi:hypothetical protein
MAADASNGSALPQKVILSAASQVPEQGLNLVVFPGF